MVYVPVSRVNDAGLVNFQEDQPAVNNFLNGIFQYNYVLLEPAGAEVWGGAG